MTPCPQQLRAAMRAWRINANDFLFLEFFRVYSRDSRALSLRHLSFGFRHF
jgi:hypothetical protein